jgi:hypothetical protein
MTSDQYDELRKDVADIKEILVRRESCQEKCERVHRWAFGNGKQGADEVVERLNRWWGGVWQITSGVVVGLVVGIGVLVAGRLF